MAGRGYSKETKAMLQTMMSDSKLNAAEQRRMLSMLDKGPKAPAPPPRRPRMPPVSNHLTPYYDPLRGVPLNPNLTRGHARRSQADIRRDVGGYERDMYRGSVPGPNREAQKARLQDEYLTMDVATCRAPGVPMHSGVRSRVAGCCSENTSQVGVGGARSSVQEVSQEATLHREISQEIEERQAFLRSMGEMGRAAEHEEGIRQEINERMASLTHLENLMRARD